MNIKSVSLGTETNQLPAYFSENFLYLFSNKCAQHISAFRLRQKSAKGSTAVKVWNFPDNQGSCNIYLQWNSIGILAFNFHRSQGTALQLTLQLADLNSHRWDLRIHLISSALLISYKLGIYFVKLLFQTARVAKNSFWYLVMNHGACFTRFLSMQPPKSSSILLLHLHQYEPLMLISQVPLQGFEGSKDVKGGLYFF